MLLPIVKNLVGTDGTECRNAVAPGQGVGGSGDSGAAITGGCITVIDWKSLRAEG
jgi:hypothetical protein